MNKTISNLPDWLVAGIEDYRQKHDLQSWSQAASLLLTIGFHQATVDEPERDDYLGGDKATENSLFDEYEQAGYDGGFQDWLLEKVTQSWGGKRR